MGKRISTVGMTVAFQHRNTGKFRVASMVGPSVMIESRYEQALSLNAEKIYGDSKGTHAVPAVFVGLEAEYLLIPHLSVVTDATSSAWLFYPLSLTPSMNLRWHF
jgi:hypothetical protein